MARIDGLLLGEREELTNRVCERVQPSADLVIGSRRQRDRRSRRRRQHARVEWRYAQTTILASRGKWIFELNAAAVKVVEPGAKQHVDFVRKFKQTRLNITVRSLLPSKTVQ